MIDLFSSLPPSINRFNDRGENIGDSYFRQCLESWSQHEFRVFTINSSLENPPRFEREYAVHRLKISRDAMDQCGKPLIYFNDFLLAAIERSRDLIAITNADIEFNFSSDDLRCIYTLQRGEFIAERRRDYEFGRHNNSKPYKPGFDFFVVHRDDAKILLGNELIFGMPWWDYFVSTKLLAHGLIRQPLPSISSIYHLMHDERWNSSHFVAFGKKFRAELDKVRDNLRENSGFQTLLDRLIWCERNNPAFPYPRRSKLIRNLIRLPPDDSTLNRILWMSSLCIRFYENPEERRLGLFNFDRIMNRLPF